MFHRAVDLEFKEGTSFEVTFSNGEIKRYNIAGLFVKYPEFEALNDRKLFKSGKMYSYGIRWNDELDIEMETVYEDGETVGMRDMHVGMAVAYAVRLARAEANMTQAELAKKSGIDQGDISRIERGLANPSVGTLSRLAEAMGRELDIKIG